MIDCSCFCVRCVCPSCGVLSCICVSLLRCHRATTQEIAWALYTGRLHFCGRWDLGCRLSLVWVCTSPLFGQDGCGHN